MFGVDQSMENAFVNSSAEENGFLADDRHVLSQPPQIQSADILAI